MDSKIFYSACLGFGIGVAWASLLPFIFPAYFLITAGCFFLILSILTIFKKNLVIIFSIFALTFFLGVLRFNLAQKPPPENFERQVGKIISLSGLIIDEPAKSESGVKLTLETDSPKTGIVIFAKNDGGYRYGDKIEVTGSLEKPKNFMTDQGLEFDYVNYLRKDGIFYAMRNPGIKILSSGHGNIVKSILFSIKEQFSSVIAKTIPAPESIVMGGIILGERYAFSQSLRQLFMDTGTIHIVTIGGYHVTLVAQWIMKIFGFLPRYAGIGAGIVSIFLYILVTGGAQTSIRAGIMAALALVAQLTGRMYTAGHALIVAAIVMILINPFVLVYDVSFELSFMATIAVIFLSPRIEPYFQFLPWKWLRNIVAITFSMYAFALPFILYRMGTLSLVSLPANILIVPLLPLTMITGFLTGFAGLISPALAILPGKIAFELLHYQITAISILAHLPFAALTIPDFPLALVVVIYVIFSWVLFREYKYEKVPEANSSKSRFYVRLDRYLLILIVPFLITFVAAGFLYYRHYTSQQVAHLYLQNLLNPAESADVFAPDVRTKPDGCKIQGPYPDRACSPGAIFENVVREKICVKGYTQTVRSVSTSTRKQVFAEYGIAYPQPSGAYEVDHFIPLALGGSNDIANLFLEAAEPTPGFHEKDIVEVYLQQEVCSGRAALGAAQRQIATDWLVVYNNLTTEQILAIKKKYPEN